MANTIINVNPLRFVKPKEGVTIKEGDLEFILVDPRTLKVGDKISPNDGMRLHCGKIFIYYPHDAVSQNVYRRYSGNWLDLDCPRVRLLTIKCVLKHSVIFDEKSNIMNKCYSMKFPMNNKVYKLI